MWDIFIETGTELMNGSFGYALMLIMTGLLIVFGGGLWLAIDRTGKVPIIGYFLRNKELDNELLQKKYKIQGIYTLVIGLIGLILTLSQVYTNIQIFVIFIVFAVFDFLYDYIAIKSVLK